MNSANLFPGVKVILIETSHPGNIGAAARAMKNMGLTELVLVNPLDFPNPKAIFRSASAEDVVQGAQVVATLDEAIADCQLVIGTSARERRIPWPLLNPRECGEKVAAEFKQGHKVGLLFGRESRGLKNEELQKCQFHVNIPTGEAYSSLNLGMAVQVICYEILQAKMALEAPLEASNTSLRVSNTSLKAPDSSLKAPDTSLKAPDTSLRAPDLPSEWDMPFADAAAVEHLFDHLEETLVQVGFHDPENPRQLMTRLRRLFNRVRMDQMEVNILRGFLTAINKLGKSEGAGNPPERR